MDIEQLKLILEALKGAGDGAYKIGILFFIKEYLSTFMLALWPISIWIIIKGIISIIKTCYAEDRKDE